MQNKNKLLAGFVFAAIVGLGLFLKGSGTPAVPSGAWAVTGAVR